MRILSVGGFSAYGISNTCLHRHWALEFAANSIDLVDTSKKLTFWYRVAHFLFQKGLPVRLPDGSNSNSLIKKYVSHNSYDVIWIDKGITINRSTLCYVKNKLPDCKIVSFSPDNMALRHNQSQNYLNSVDYYDFTFTTKSYILNDLKKMGIGNVCFMHKTYEEKFHYPRKLSEDEIEKFAADVGFIGSWEKERCDSILYLADNGIKVKVFGNTGWESYVNYSENLIIHKELFSDEYPKALQTFKISLCFLRKMNFDQQTARTMEIPACGGFMLAERTDEHLQLFEEGKEADFFSSNEELLKKCKYYLTHGEERKKISLAGLERCKTSGYSNKDAIQKMLKIVLDT